MKKGLLAALAALMFVSSAHASDRRVKIINHSDETINRVLGSNVSESHYQYDFLGSDVIPPHSSRVVNISDGDGWCRFDLKIITTIGSTIVRNNVDVCKLATWDIWN
jgi:hypothetical protein